MQLYSFHRSTASFRVRIALNLKGIPFETISVNLTSVPGEHETDVYRQLNPQGLLPTLVDGKVAVHQSIAICEYLEHVQPEPALLPGHPADRARVRGLAAALASDIHPLHSIRVSRHLARAFGASDTQRGAWVRHWIEEGLSGIERLLANSTQTGLFCHGDAVTLADAFLVPQVIAAQAYDVDTARFTTVAAITARCLTLPAFEAALPARQPDAVPA
ncbi:maleylacetoacetate isomerase (plasmid) [Paraburkholderia sprentiae WSM5005]|uniref:Maleylacetoacetate isomerase n=1 Tax=Paraburkholderia sprentiae WSM5005 TaxID=754502 RepID=A0ACA8AX90_9BURK|nr:maleylacetoacetate isomerase [Paraburkholderia sprentiae]APA90340.1 maleylacetoacetate isomerase [Paraburkholderia sprentiae WSM5005]